jgi:homospermidine synthase
VNHPLTRENFRHVLDPFVGRGDFVLNLSIDVSSVALIKLCHEKGALYLDTCIEPWPGGYTDPNIPASRRTNYALREEVLELRKGWSNGPTAVITHGANPGLVSHFVKQALLDIARDTGTDAGDPKTRDDWANLAKALGVKVIHIAERDTQVSSKPKMPGEFVNTWSVDGFVSEGSQPAELGWGTHERHFPRDGRQHDFGRKSAIFLTQPGCSTRVRTWTPEAQHFHGFLITHGESISISDFLTVRQNDRAIYRPTVHYAYHPSDNAVLSVHEFCGKNYQIQAKKRIMMGEITAGMDELGVLLAGHAKNAYWYGSQLSIDEARKLAPYNSATSLQVTVAALSGMVWAIENPAAGIVEPDDIDFRRNLEVCKPYLGLVVGKYTDWSPLFDRGRLFPEDLDESDPWQFKNIRVV